MGISDKSGERKIVKPQKSSSYLSNPPPTEWDKGDWRSGESTWPQAEWPGSNSQIQRVLKRFSIECRKTNTKVTTGFDQ